MISPEIGARRLLISLGLGAVLGFFYGFLRPVRVRHRQLGDLCFVGAAWAVWVYQSFGLCQGDLRPGYWVALVGGGILWEMTAGRLLRPVFFFLHRWFDRFFGFPFRLSRKFFAKTGTFLKNLFASVKKSGTMKKIKKAGKQPGRKGGAHGRKKAKGAVRLQAKQ